MSSKRSGIQQSIELAIQHHQGGRLAQAERLYRDILKAVPRQPVALHFLGVIAQQRGDHDSAIKLIARAVEVKPGYAMAHFNLGLAYLEKARFQEAEASFSAAAAVKPDYAEAHANLGITRQKLGKLNEAANSFSKAIVLSPDIVELHIFLGNALRDLGRQTESSDSLDRAAKMLIGQVMGGGKFDDAESALPVLQGLYLKHPYLANFFIRAFCEVWGDKIHQMMDSGDLEQAGRNIRWLYLEIEFDKTLAKSLYRYIETTGSGAEADSGAGLAPATQMAMQSDYFSMTGQNEMAERSAAECLRFLSPVLAKKEDDRYFWMLTRKSLKNVRNRQTARTMLERLLSHRNN